MTSLALVAMHLCHRNLLGLRVDAAGEIDALAGGHAEFEFVFYNDTAVERCDIEIQCADVAGGIVTYSVAPHGYCRAARQIPAERRGVLRWDQFEVRTRYPFGWFRAWNLCAQSPRRLRRARTRRQSRIACRGRRQGHRRLFGRAGAMRILQAFAPTRPACR